MRDIYMGQELELRLDNEIATLIFSRPEAYNALTVQMAEECLHATELLAKEAGVKALVLRGAGKAFMAGGDLKALRADPIAVAQGIIDPMHASIQLWKDMPCLVIACVQGPVAGAGLSILCAADMVLAADNSRFVYAYSEIATTSDLGLSWSLPRRIGNRRALEMATVRGEISADQALEWGLVNKLVPKDQLDAELLVWLEVLSKRPAHVIAATLRLFNSSEANSLSEHLDAERDSFIDCVVEPEFSTAVDRFLSR